MNKARENKARANKARANKDVSRAKDGHEEKILMFMLSFVISTIPLVVRLSAVTVGEEAKAIFSIVEYDMDFFSYYKALTFIGAVFVLLLVVSYSLYRKQILISKSPYNWAVLIYGSFIILSTFFSDHRLLSIIGAPNRYEGMLVLLSYLFIMMVSMYFITNEKRVKYLLYSLLVSSFLIAIVGLMQIAGYDIFMSEMGLKLIIPVEYRNVINDLNFNFSMNSEGYGTLSNPNYLGSYLSLVIPICLAFIFIAKDKLIKLLLVALQVLLLINLWGTKSRIAIIAVLLSLILMTLFFWKKLFERKTVVRFSFLVVVSLMLAMHLGLLENAITNFLDSLELEIQRPAYQIKSISFDLNRLIIEKENITIQAVINKDGISFLNREDRPLAFKVIKNRILFLDEEYSDYIFILEDLKTANIMTFKHHNVKINFFVYKNGFGFINPRGYVVEIEDAKHIDFQGYEMWGGGRGYKWSRSLPLLTESWLIGFGADTYAMHFPQNDYVAKLRYFGKMNIVIDTPHNMFLHTAINTGMISVLSKFLIIALYAYSSIKLLRKSNTFSDIEKIAVAIFCAIVAYLISGITTDSVISVAPVFWILLGTGIAVNSSIKKKQENKLW